MGQQNTNRFSQGYLYLAGLMGLDYALDDFLKAYEGSDYGFTGNSRMCLWRCGA